MVPDLRLRHPFLMMVAGPTGSGKTVLVRKLLSQHKEVITPTKPVLSVLWIHGQEQDLHEVDVPGVEIEYTCQLPTCLPDPKPDVIIIDDLMEELGSDKRLTALFTKTSHHEKISVVFIAQNMFARGREIRTVSLNSHYILLLKSARDRQQILALGRQVFPERTAFFSAVLEEALRQPFSHLLLDLTSQCPDDQRLRQRHDNGWQVYS